MANENEMYPSENLEIKNRRMTLDWIMTKPEWQLFTATVTMKTKLLRETKQPIENMKQWTKYGYENRVLNKVKKRLCRSQSKWHQLIALEDCYQYEFGQGSYFKPVPKEGSPHHIHGVFAVKTEYRDRIYDIVNSRLDHRLSKDLYSLDCVSSFLIEPLRYEEGHQWMNYMFKGKTTKELIS